MRRIICWMFGHRKKRYGNRGVYKTIRKNKRLPAWVTEQKIMYSKKAKCTRCGIEL